MCFLDAEAIMPGVPECVPGCEHPVLITHRLIIDAKSLQPKRDT